jgi:long-chain acyl-CoA synthetase
MNLAKLAAVKAMNEGNRVFLYYAGREITNTEMLRASMRLSTAFRNLGVQKGDRVILQTPNCPEVLQAFYALWQIGAVVVPINYMVGEEETAFIYEDSGAKVVISSKIYLPKIRSCQAKSLSLKHVILIDEDVSEGVISFKDLVENSPESVEIEETADDDNAAIIYTAGTTGGPKGVVHTHASLYENARSQFESVPMPEGTKALIVLPLCHSYGIAIVNNGLFRKGQAVLLNSFDPEVIFTAIEKYKIDVMTGVPTMFVYLLLYSDIKKYDLSSVKYWISGAAPLSLETWKRFKECFGAEIIEGWGLTEAGANNSVNPIMGLKKVGSIGLPMKRVEMKIFDDMGEEVPQGEEGEIVIRGPVLMKAYWNRPSETAEALKGGWLHTGDVGYVDEDGYFWITDRKKDLIIKGGENISPRIIEELLYSHPKVFEAAVVGMKDDLYGEDVKACLVLKPGQESTQDEIIDFCRSKLKSFLVPREVVFLESFPKNLVGKILKKELRRMQTSAGNS